ncbi:MAG TPA: hypothetical protein VI408_04380 [Gaiellaceae bacterium]
MDPHAYRAFTDELRERAAADDRVVGLVAVGSMAQQDYRSDRWSDHDFLLIARDGAQEELRRDLSWLPRAGEIALSFRETAHGLKVLYRDGHLLEFAVFDLEELGVASIDRYRVLLDRGGVESRVREVRARPSHEPTDEYLFGQLVTNAQVAIGRTARGEVLSGAFFLTSAKRHLCALVARHVRSENRNLLDPFDPLRRFERAYPELGAEIAAAGPGELLRIAQRALGAVRPDLAWAALEAVLLEQA